MEPEESIHEQVEGRLGSDGVTFNVPEGRSLPQPLRQALRKVHINLGHPSVADLQRFLRLGGAKKELVEAAAWIDCTTCRHKMRPKPPRTGNIPPPELQFGDHLKIDAVMIYDSMGKGHWFLSVVDKCTMFHQVYKLPSHSASNIFAGLKNCWFTWAGVPREITCDQEGGFSSEELSRLLSVQGVELCSVAGQAHFEAGKIEKHNQILKSMMEGVVKHAHVTQAEIEDAVKETCVAKNSLVREHGFSPVSLVFGREPRYPGEVHEDGAPASYHFSVAERESGIAHKVRFRYLAKLEFIKVQTRIMLSRTLRNRTRICLHPKVGDRAFFWREPKNRKSGEKITNWIGPSCVIGLHKRNAWVTFGGRCYLVAPEHLRYASEEEAIMLEPEMQRALQAFRKAPEGASYSDLTEQNGPMYEDDRRNLVHDHDVLEFLNSIKGPGWTRYGEGLVKVTQNASCLEGSDRKHVDHERSVRVSLIRDGQSWVIIGVDDMSSCRVKRASINMCPWLVTMFFSSVPQWVLDHDAKYQEVLGEGGDRGAGDFDLEHELPTEVRIRCGHPGWHDDYEGGPYLVSHNATTFRTPVPRYSAKNFPLRTTWVRNEFGAWKQLERGVRWEGLDDPKAPIPDGEAKILVTIFSSERTPDDLRRERKKTKTEDGNRAVFAVSSQKAKRAVEKEVPYSQIPPHQRQAYNEARVKEWTSWTTYDAATPLSTKESERVRREKGDRVIKSRYVYRDKHAGMTDDHGNALPLKAKARLCVQGQHDPDCASDEVKVDAPTIQKVTFMTFLHLCASFGWIKSLRAGDVSSAFLQGRETSGEPLYMEQPSEGIPGMEQ